MGYNRVEIDLIHKGIKTALPAGAVYPAEVDKVEIDLIHKGIKTIVTVHHLSCLCKDVEIDLIHKGIKTNGVRFRFKKAHFR